MCRAPVCQPRRHRAQGFQAGNGTHPNTGSFLTWLTPWRRAHSTARLIIAAEQTNTCRLQVTALVDFYRKWWLWKHSISVFDMKAIFCLQQRIKKNEKRPTSIKILNRRPQMKKSTVLNCRDNGVLVWMKYTLIGKECSKTTCMSVVFLLKLSNIFRFGFFFC